MLRWKVAMNSMLPVCASTSSMIREMMQSASSCGIALKGTVMVVELDCECAVQHAYESESLRFQTKTFRFCFQGLDLK